MFWGLSWNVEVPQKILAEINENVDIITVSKLNRIQTYYDVIVYDETIPISGLDEKSLIDNPIIEILETPLRGNLYLVNIKEAKKLISQAEFRTSLKNSGFFREKIPIMKTMNFIFLQMFHEKTQTRQYLDIYRKIWEGWHHELTKALSWSTGQIVKGGMTQLSSIYSDASRLELFFAGQFADMNLQVKLEELSKTLLYHLYLTSLSGSSISILIDDLDLETSEIKLEKLKILTEESSFLEYIDPIVYELHGRKN